MWHVQSVLHTCMHVKTLKLLTCSEAPRIICASDVQPSHPWARCKAPPSGGSLSSSKFGRDGYVAM